MDVHFHKINFLEARKWVKGWRLRLLTWVMQSVNRDPQGRSLGRQGPHMVADLLVRPGARWARTDRGGAGTLAAPGQGERP